MKKLYIYMVSAVVVIACIGALITLSNQNNNLQAKNKALTNKVTTQNEQISNFEVVSGLTVSPSEVKFLQTFFKDYLNYDSDSYDLREQKLSGKTSSDVLNKLRGSGGVGVGESGEGKNKIYFQSESTSVQIFLNPSKQHEFLVYATVEYSIDSKKISTTNQLFQVNVKENEDNYIVDRFIIKGNLEELEEV